MKKGTIIKVLSLGICLVMLMAMVPQGLSVFADDEFIEDTIFFNNDGNSSHGSSGAGAGADTNTSSWTLAHTTSNAVIDDPTDAANKVVSVFLNSNANSGFGRGNNIRFDNHGIISERVYFPDKISGAMTINYQPIGGKRTMAVKFTYDTAAEDYAITIGNSSAVVGRVAKETWITVNQDIRIEKRTADKEYRDITMNISVVGDLKDAGGNAVTKLAGTNTNSIEYNVSNWGTHREVLMHDFTAPGSPATPEGFYIDDIKMYEVGSFVIDKVETERYAGDTIGNINLNGKVKLTMMHNIDVATFDAGKIIVSNGNDILPVTNVIFDISKPNIITLDFAGDTLDKYTTFDIGFDESVKDIAGQSLFEENFFQTLGGFNETRPKVAPEPTPIGGYIMPDKYNTGHITPKEELVDFYVKYPEFAGITNIKIDEAMAKKYNYTFEGFTLGGPGKHIRINVNTDNVTIRDFFMESYDYVAIGGDARNTLVEDGEMIATNGTAVSGDGKTLRRLYIHDVGADHLKPGDNWLVESCYLTDGGNGSHMSHADGMQMSGSSGKWINNIRIRGNRVDMPTLPYYNVSNSPMFLSLNFGNASNVELQYNWLNGGGWSTYITDGGGTFDMIHVTFANNMYGGGQRYGEWNVGIKNAATELPNYETDNIKLKEANIPCVGSVVYTNEDGERIYDLDNAAGGTLKVMANIANYTLVEQDVYMVAELKKNGNVIASAPLSTTVSRYIHPDEYYVNPVREYQLLMVAGFSGFDGFAGKNERDRSAALDARKDDLEARVLELNAREDLNIEAHWWPTETGGPSWHFGLKSKPNLPQNVEREVTFANIPEETGGYTVEVKVYKTNASGALLRSDVLTSSAEDDGSNEFTVAALNASKEGSDCFISASVRNTFTDAKELNFTVAVYNEDKLVHVDIVPQSIAVTTGSTHKFKYEPGITLSGTHKIKVMVWDTETMQPLCAAFEKLVSAI